MFKYSNYRRLSIFLLGFSIVIFFFLCIILFNMFYNDQKANMLKDTELKLDLIATQSKSNIQNTFDNFIFILEQMAKNPEVINVTEKGKENLAFTFDNYFTYLKAITRVDKNGKIIYTYPEIQRVIGNDISKQKHMYKLLITHKPVISEVFWAVQGYHAVAIHVPVFNNGEFAGSIAFVMDFTKLSQKFLHEINIGFGNKPLLLSKEGIVLYSKNRDTIGKAILSDSSSSESEKQLYSNMIIGKEGFTSIQKNLDDNTVIYFASYKKIELGDTYWSIAVFIGENEVISDFSSFKNKLLVIFVILFLGGVTFVFFITKAWGIISKDTTVKEYLTKLEESEKRYKILFDDNHTIKLLTDPSNLKIVDANGAAQKFYGYTKTEFLKLKLSDINVNPPEKVAVDLKNTEMQSSAFYEYKHKMKDGTVKDVEIYAGLIEFNNKKYIYSNIHDATERKKAAEALLKSKEDAEKANKLKDAFIANISHEIRTPLNGILGMTSLLRDSLKQYIGEEEQDFFYGIDRASKRIIRTIDMIVNYSRFQIGDFPYSPKMYDMDKLINDLVKEFRTTFAAKNLPLEFSNKLGKINLYLDEYSIIQAIGNILDNAVKFTSAGFVKLMLYKDLSNQVCLDIKDTGKGISPEYIDNLFKPYSQEEIGYNRSFEGIGLGLSLVKKYLDLNNCEISVQSEKDKGTTFTIKFPKAEV